MVVVPWPVPHTELKLRQVVDPWEDEQYDTPSTVRPPQRATSPPYSDEDNHLQVAEVVPDPDSRMELTTSSEEHNSVIFESSSDPAHDLNEGLHTNRSGPLSKGGQAGVGILLALLGIAFAIMIVFKVGQWKHVWKNPLQMWNYMREKMSRGDIPVPGKFGFKRWRRRVGKQVARGESIGDKQQQKHGFDAVPKTTEEEAVPDALPQPTARTNVPYRSQHPWTHAHDDRNTTSQCLPGPSSLSTHPNKVEVR